MEGHESIEFYDAWFEGTKVCKETFLKRENIAFYFERTEKKFLIFVPNFRFWEYIQFEKPTWDIHTWTTIALDWVLNTNYSYQNIEGYYWFQDSTELNFYVKFENEDALFNLWSGQPLYPDDLT